MHFDHPPRSSPIDVVTMMPMVMAPVVVVPRAKAANLARAVIGPDHTAVAVRVVIIGRRIVEVPVNAVVAEREPAVTKAAAAENMRGSKPAAMEHGATASECAAMKDCPAPMGGAEANSAMATMAAKASSTTVAAKAAMATTADVGRQSARGGFRRGRSTRIDQRQRFRALAWRNRQHQHRGGRKTEATDDAAPGIYHLDHV